MVNFYPMDTGYIVMWQSDLVNTKESVLPDCDKPYHTDKRILQNGEELENFGTMQYTSTR